MQAKADSEQDRCRISFLAVERDDVDTVEVVEHKGAYLINERKGVKVPVRVL